MCVVCLKYSIIILINILPFSASDKIIIVYFKHITHTVVIITHYRRMGYIIIPKPNCWRRESINSCRRRFDFFRFAVLAQSVAAMTTVVADPTGRWRSTVTGRWYIQLNTRAATRFHNSLCVFFAYKKLQGRTEMRTRETVDTNSLRYLPRRSNKNCDLPFVNSDRQI